MTKYEVLKQDMIKALKEKDKFKKSNDGSFLKTGEKEICIKCYKKVENL